MYDAGAEGDGCHAPHEGSNNAVSLRTTGNWQRDDCAGIAGATALTHVMVRHENEVWVAHLVVVRGVHGAIIGQREDLVMHRGIQRFAGAALRSSVAPAARLDNGHTHEWVRSLSASHPASTVMCSVCAAIDRESDLCVG